jgi:hypothetical protein
MLYISLEVVTAIIVRIEASSIVLPVDTEFSKERTASIFSVEVLLDEESVRLYNQVVMFSEIHGRR